MARVHVEFHSRLAQSRQFRGLFRGHVHRHDRALHFLRYANIQINPLKPAVSRLPSPFTPTYRRAAHRTTRHLRRPIRPRTLPPRQALLPNSDRRRALDRLHMHRLLPPGAQPGQRADAQLRPRCRRDRPRLCPWILGRKRPQVVRGAHQADRRCALR